MYAVTLLCYNYYTAHWEYCIENVNIKCCLFTFEALEIPGGGGTRQIAFHGGGGGGGGYGYFLELHNASLHNLIFHNAILHDKYRSLILKGITLHTGRGRSYNKAECHAKKLCAYQY